jgi:hypothetical protein
MMLLDHIDLAASILQVEEVSQMNLNYSSTGYKGKQDRLKRTIKELPWK